jgi:diacylglycerol kinase (ATP)
MAPVNKPGTQGLAHIVKAWGYSMLGLRAALKYEEAFRLELMACIVLLPLALWLGNTGVERALLTGSLLLVLLVELLNSGLEAVVDRIGIEQHALSGRAKDLGSAAVFIALLNALLVWALIFFDRLI